jgi:hypothetical protein
MGELKGLYLSELLKEREYNLLHKRYREVNLVDKELLRRSSLFLKETGR